MKIKKLKIKLNKDNEYSDYRYFIPKSNNIKMTDGRDVDEAVQSLKDKIANLKEQANYLINKAPLVKYAEGASIVLTNCANDRIRKFTIEGDSWQETRSGKNEFNSKAIPEMSGTTYGVESKIDDDGIITLSNNTNSSGYLSTRKTLKELCPKLKVGDIAYLYLETTHKTQGLWLYDEEVLWAANTSKTITQATLDGIVSIYGGNEQTDTLKIQITLDELLTDYEPYGVSPSIDYPSKVENIENVEIYINSENLFDKDNALKAIGAKEAEYVSTTYIPVKPGDIITKTNKTYLFIYDNTKTQIISKTGWITGTITEENAAYVRCNVSRAELDTFMIVKNQELPKEYIQGHSQTKTLHMQQPFRAVKDVKDKFVKQNGVWYEEHDINHLVFNGTENWKLDTTKEVTQVYKYYSPSLFPQKQVAILSNYFIDKVAGDNEGITVGYGQIYIAVNKTTASTEDDFKTKLTELYDSGMPLYVDYILETPELIPCTSEQVEVLENLQSYDKITYYNVDKINNVQANIKLIYKQDINAILEEEGV